MCSCMDTSNVSLMLAGSVHISLPREKKNNKKLLVVFLLHSLTTYSLIQGKSWSRKMNQICSSFYML